MQLLPRPCLSQLQAAQQSRCSKPPASCQFRDPESKPQISRGILTDCLILFAALATNPAPNLTPGLCSWSTAPCPAHCQLQERLRNSRGPPGARAHPITPRRATATRALRRLHHTAQVIPGGELIPFLPSCCRHTAPQGSLPP